MRPSSRWVLLTTHLVRNPWWPDAAEPGRIPTAGGVLIVREAVDLIGGQGFHLAWACPQPMSLTHKEVIYEQSPTGGG